MTIADVLQALQANPASEFCVTRNLNLYDSPRCDRLATQAGCDRQLCLTGLTEVECLLEPLNLSDPSEASETSGMPQALAVTLREDGYPAWLAVADLEALRLADRPYQPIAVARADIEARLPAIVQFAWAAQGVANEYLWGGTVAPHYDCSGLMQAAFQSQGIWLPRDAYQQEAFVRAIAVKKTVEETVQSPMEWGGDRLDYTPLQPGDLVFFGPPAKATHVGLYLGEGQYIHSSGKDMGRNGIGIDELRGDEAAHPVSRAYYALFRGAGRVMESYRAKG